MSAGGSARQRRKRTEYRSDGTAAKRGLQYIVLPVIILVALGIVASLVARPLYRKYRESRGRAAALRSMEEFAAGETAQAVRSLRLALQMAPEDPTVMRNAARILSTEDIPDALNYWQKAFQKGEGTTEERLRCAALALRLRRYADAKAELDVVLKSEPNNTLAHRLMISFSQSTGDVKAAIDQARKIVEIDGSVTNRYLLGDVLVRASRAPMSGQSGAEQQVKWAEEGSGILLPLATAPGPFQSGAAWALADSVILGGDAAKQVVDALSRKEPRTAGDMITVAVIRTKADPKILPETSQALVQELSKSPLPDRLQAADWLAGMGAPKLAAQLISPADSATNATAAYLEMDLAIQNKSWDRIKQGLSQSNLVFVPTVTNVMAAAVAVSNNELANAENILRTAIDTSNFSVSADSELTYLARSAERLGLNRVALAAHEARLPRGNAVMDASDNVLRLATLEQGRDPQFPGMLRQYAALEARHSAVPDDVATASLYQYTAAILGRNLPAVQSELTAMLQKFPGRPEPVLCLAMVALKLGNIPEATRIMEENPVDPASLAVRLKPMMIHILGQIGQKEQARLLAQKVNLSQHFLEERELVTPWLQQ